MDLETVSEKIVTSLRLSTSAIWKSMLFLDSLLFSHKRSQFKLLRILISYEIEVRVALAARSVLLM